jgi:hypothetical protein
MLLTQPIGRDLLPERCDLGIGRWSIAAMVSSDGGNAASTTCTVARFGGCDGGATERC